MSQMTSSQATQPPSPSLRVGSPPHAAFDSLHVDPASHFITAPKKASRSNIYVAAWALIALAAASYVAVVLVKPGFIGEWVPGVERLISQLQRNETSSNPTETARLRKNLQDSQSEVSRLRSLLAEREAQAKTAELRIAGLEQELKTARNRESGPYPAEPSPRTEPVSGDQPVSADAAPSEQRTLANSIGAPATPGTPEPGQPRPFELVNARPHDAAPATITTASTLARLEAAEPNVDLPLPTRRPKPPLRRVSQVAPVQPQPVTRIETGSVTAPVTFGAPVVTRQPEGNIGVRLTAGPSVDALRLSWSLMSERYSNVLGGLQPRYVTDGAPAAPYALLAGPLRSTEDAQNVCGSLIAKGIPCSVDGFKGNAL
ncbi:MAG: hypothetical protein H6875_05370 [Hyphomicrobiaceae bacterium]|nr:hypothetical protein [Hyphomicrobiaceae bacterium]